jgi:recombinational DNA repair protein (RecF pathway)
MRAIYSDGNKTIYVSQEATDTSDEVQVTEWHVLPSEGVLAALNACLGVWSLQDAVNFSGITAERLEFEVAAWAAAAALAVPSNEPTVDEVPEPEVNKPKRRSRAKKAE